MRLALFLNLNTPLFTGASTPGGAFSAALMEDGTSGILMEDGTSYILL